MSAQPWPTLAGWLDPSVPAINKAIVVRCFHDIGICEVPAGSNRSGRIDAYNQRTGAPIASYWCASWSTAVWEDCGADLPKTGRASCDVIRAWGKTEKLWHPEPVDGAFVLYGTEADASHIGIVIRSDPYLISCEGNAAFSGFSRNGEAVVVKRVDPARVLGYVHPRQKGAL